MQAPPFHQPYPTPRIWLVAGTGEGPPLAAWLLERGWGVRVSVVGEAAARAYRPHPRLELRVGAIGGDAAAADPARAVRELLLQARRAGAPFRWVIDASHPFAARISAALAEACAALEQPLLRLERPRPELAGATLLSSLDELPGAGLAGRRLLLAIGARRLAQAIARCPAAVHHARILPSAGALRQAMAAGLPAARVALLRPPSDPGAAAAVEAALCRRWHIEAVLARRSGGPSEAHWRRICRRQGMRLLLLERPPEPDGLLCLPLAELRARVGRAPGLPV